MKDKEGNGKRGNSFDVIMLYQKCLNICIKIYEVKKETFCFVRHILMFLYKTAVRYLFILNGFPLLAYEVKWKNVVSWLSNERAKKRKGRSKLCCGALILLFWKPEFSKSILYHSTQSFH